MQEIYQRLYKPMRNRLAKVNLESALAAIWEYSNHLESDRSLPEILRPAHGSIREYFQLWQLVALGREVIMHCARVGGGAFTYRIFADAMNSITEITEALSFAPTDADVEEVMRSLDAAAHQQFPLQKPMDIAQLLRYVRIFGDDAINPIVRTAIGFDYGQCCFFLIALTGSLARTSCVNGDQRYDEFNIPPEACAALFQWISAPAGVLSLEMKTQHSLDANWATRWNLLGTTPLIQHDPRYPQRMHCPIPALLWHRVGQGMFYDLYRHKGFSQAFGTAFEAHVLEFAEYHLPSPAFTVEREQPFFYNKNRLDGADGMIADGTGTLIVECKTKRMKVESKQVAPGNARQEDLEILAKAIAQLYKNAVHVREGRTQWPLRSATLYPVVVTLEDWFLFSPAIKNDLGELVRAQLVQSNLSPDLTDTMPYTVVSCDEYEKMVLAISRRSIGGVMANKVRPERRDWMMRPYLSEHHREDLAALLPGAYVQKFEQFQDEMAASWRAAEH